MTLLIQIAEIWIRIFALVGLAILLYMLWAIIDGYRKAKESKSWPTVHGIIVESDLHQWITQEHSSDSSIDHDVMNYAPCISYEYDIDGMHYRGEKINLEVVHSRDFSAVKSLLEKYPLGKQVVVHYNPSDHNESVLETDYGSFGTWLMFILCIVMAIAMLFLILRPGMAEWIVRAFLGRVFHFRG